MTLAVDSALVLSGREIVGWYALALLAAVVLGAALGALQEVIVTLLRVLRRQGKRDE